MKKFSVCLLLIMSWNAIAMNKNSLPTNYSKISNAVKKAAPYIAYTVGLVAAVGTTYYIGSQLTNSDEWNNLQPQHMTCDYTMINKCLNNTHEVTKFILNCYWKIEN